jgi:dCTP diphosphatase
MNDATATIAELKKIANEFIEERDWRQFHDPKNMAMNLTGEAAELMEHFRWVNNKDSYGELEKNRDAIEQEVGDVFFALLDFCNYSNIDLVYAFRRKLKLTGDRKSVV